jgi:hypothetical protein
MVPLTMQSWASAYREQLQPPRMQSTAHDETRTAREGKKQEERYFRSKADTEGCNDTGRKAMQTLAMYAQ